MGVRKWSFQNEVNRSRAAAMVGRRLGDEVALFLSDTQGDIPISIATFLNDVGLARYFEAVVLLAEDRDMDAWRRLHLMWRYEAFKIPVWRVYREYEINAKPKQAKFGSLPAQRLNCVEFTSWLMVMARAVVLDEVRIAESLGDFYFSLWNELPLGVDNDIYSAGPVAPWLFSVYCRWRNLPIDLAAKGVVLSEPFKTLHEAWDDEPKFNEAFLKLCDLHAKKSANLEIDDNDLVFGLQNSLPTELLFLQRVRKDLQMPVPCPDHPLMNSPLGNPPHPFPRSGYDPVMADAYKRCQEQIPNLVVEWEEEFQKIGPEDPASLPMTDLFPPTE